MVKTEDGFSISVEGLDEVLEFAEDKARLLEMSIQGILLASKHSHPSERMLESLHKEAIYLGASIRCAIECRDHERVATTNRTAG